MNLFIGLVIGMIIGVVVTRLYYAAALAKLKAIEEQLIAEARQAFAAGKTEVLDVVKRVKAKL
jgi:uncharacterized membrane-anchored protein YhcB (DUF1043 family)